jgi:hypothetical protein
LDSYNPVNSVLAAGTLEAGKRAVCVPLCRDPSCTSAYDPGATFWQHCYPRGAARERSKKSRAKNGQKPMDVEFLRFFLCGMTLMKGSVKWGRLMAGLGAPLWTHDEAPMTQIRGAAR